MVKRKQFRVTIPENLMQDFDKSKEDMEKISGLTLTDSIFALGIIKKHLEAKDE